MLILKNLKQNTHSNLERSKLAFGVLCALCSQDIMKSSAIPSSPSPYFSRSFCSLQKTWQSCQKQLNWTRFSN